MQGITFPLWSGIQDIAVWQICAMQEYLAYQCYFFVGLFCVLITAVICLHAQVRLDIF